MKPWEVQRELAERLLLQALPATVPALCRQLGYSNVTLYRHLERLYRDRRIHVGGWESNTHRGVQAKIWHAGDGEDVPPPSASSKALESRNRYERVRKGVPSPKPGRQPNLDARQWVLAQLTENPRAVTSLNPGPRTQPAFYNLIHRLAAEDAISLGKTQDEWGRTVRSVRLGKPKSAEEWGERERARDYVSRLNMRHRDLKSKKDAMISLIWATAGRRMAA